ncbi:substance-K receptor-like isoform X1 [Stylophora pistillata]|uniref:substance-K receptor-like isoform X1 n=1 Tax=Stylophora pistillata TaxID=50429 RepID=UPI000C0413E2|nr:substance-K receptor-like isoform X1 [Stylophora pistillata]
MKSTFQASNITFSLESLSHEAMAENGTGRGSGLIHFQVNSVFYFVYAATLVISVLGNSFIIHIVRKNSTMKTTTNYLIASQAFADLYLTMIQLMNALVPSPDFEMHLWIGGLVGKATCKFFLASVVISPVFSGWMLVPIAVERFYAVSKPFESSPVSQHLKKTILLVYTWSVASSANVMVNGAVLEIGRYHYCSLPSGLTLTDISLSAFNICIILLIIIVLYANVCLKLWSREIPGEGTNQNQGSIDAHKRTARKVTRMMIIVVVSYVLCWLPCLVILTLHFLDSIKLNLNTFHLSILLALAFSGTNPYIYLTLSHNFRQALKSLLENCFEVCKAQNVPHCSYFRSRRIHFERNKTENT